jgi:hypothetical protein
MQGQCPSAEIGPFKILAPERRIQRFGVSRQIVFAPVVLLGASVGKVVAISASEYLFPRRQIELLDPSATGFRVVLDRAPEPVPDSSDGGPGRSDRD